MTDRHIEDVGDLAIRIELPQYDHLAKGLGQRPDHALDRLPVELAQQLGFWRFVGLLLKRDRGIFLIFLGADVVRESW